MAAPVTFALIALSVLGFLLTYYGSSAWVSLLSYRPFELRGGSILFLPGDNALWRAITPVFLHFGWTHIVFNSLWCWELGRRIEGRLGSLHLAGLFFVTAAVSNAVQDQVSGPVLFGGLSGVGYALLLGERTSQSPMAQSCAGHADHVVYGGLAPGVCAGSSRRAGFLRSQRCPCCGAALRRGDRSGFCAGLSPHTVVRVRPKGV